MNKTFFIFFSLIPLLSFSQIKDAYEVKSTDTLWFNSNIIKFPPFNDFQKSYLVEFDSSYLITRMTTDIICPGVEVYGFAENSDGQFHLLFTTNETDQEYFVGACIRFVLVRSAKYDSSKPSYSVGIDFDMQICSNGRN